MGGGDYPMVPVPDAIRTVMRETAKILLQRQKNGTDDKTTMTMTSTTIAADAPWDEILGQVLDDDVTMSDPGYPPYNASIMDGYAIRTNGFAVNPNADGGESMMTHQVIDKVYAGNDVPPQQHNQDSSSELPPAYYITTGAVVPESFNCVVPIEECTVSDDKKFISIKPTAVIQDKKWIRPIGCDIPAGSVVLPKGSTMDAVALGLLKQSGATSIQVKRKLVVGVLSTGNELILGPINSTQPGMIPDVNRPILLTLLASFGTCTVVDLGNERDDDVSAMAKTIDAGLEECDIIITTGGISMGETDIVERVLVDHCHGKIHFGRMHMKPGKPTTFVTIPKTSERTCIVFAMPGNPVSATVCTHLLVKPCLDLLYHGIEKEKIHNFEGYGNGDNKNATTTTDHDVINQIVDMALLHPEVEATLSNDIKLDGQRPEYHRVILDRHVAATTQGGETTFQATSTGVQRSSRLMSCRGAHGLLVLPKGNPDKPKALKGEKYPVLIINDTLGVNHPVQLKDSMHLRKKVGRDFKVAVVEVLPNFTQVESRLDLACEQVKKGLSGSKSGNAIIISRKVYDGTIDDDLYDNAVADSTGADFIVISCPSFDGSFQFHLDVSAALSKRLVKVAGSLSLQARQGAASQNAASAIFECIVGYSPENDGTMMITLPYDGLESGLGNVRGLLKHALNLARGKVHNHHHTHMHHDHAEPTRS